jgi:hypothetical protein
MTKIAFALLLLFTVNAFAASSSSDSQAEIKVRPSRAVVITCYISGTIEKITGASDSLKILRVGQTEVGYEVYSDDFFVASCDNVLVKGP